MRKTLITLGLVLSLAAPCFAQMKANPMEIKKDAEQGVFVARYPHLAGETEQEKNAALRINTTIKAVMNKLYSDVLDNWHKPAEGGKTAYVSKDIDYVITYDDENILSINFTDTFAQGDSKSLFIKDGMTFSKGSGKLLPWKRLARQEDKSKFTKDYLNGILLNGAKRGDYVLYVGFVGLDKVPKNYYVDSTGTLHFQLNPGSVGPFTGGVVDIDTGCVTADYIKEE